LIRQEHGQQSEESNLGPKAQQEKPASEIRSHTSTSRLEFVR
jgi:hypothetical protein